METSAVVVMLCVSFVAVFGNVRKKDLNRGMNELSESDYLQELPPKAKTAEKIHRFFLGGCAASIHPLWYARDKSNTRKKRLVKSRNSYYDVAFLIDASGSIKEKDFYNGIKALNILITKAKISTKYAVITFSEKGDIKSFFMWPPSKIRAVLKTTEYQGFRTNTQDALRKCRQGLFMNSSSGARRGSYKRVLIVTDGRSNIKNELTLYRAAKLKNYHIEIFVLAVGKYIQGIDELAELATSKQWHLFRVETMEGLIEVVKMIPPNRIRTKVVIT
ncbi:integrin alpha-X [Exaiptasia diaphana]|uniref:VWFA domain-containing protein n=1 Tax=Exaiptasia diaphana TaxID=2652724 RepID=A0A913XDB1_EXADI|nr:integrin alpha-X [Exaiptasia diaphana]KXJ26358.1 Integrin alpha-X [Exaiptasia diaphana]